MSTIFVAFFFILHPRIFTFLFFFFNDPATTEIYTLSLHDALPILCADHFRVRHERRVRVAERRLHVQLRELRSEEHTSELQSPMYLVCRLLLEKKKKKEKQRKKRRNYTGKKTKNAKNRIKVEMTTM